MWTHDYTQRTLSAKLCNLKDPVQTHTHTLACTHAYEVALKHRQMHFFKKKLRHALVFLCRSLSFHTHACTHWHPHCQGCAVFCLSYSLKTSPSWQIIWDFGALIHKTNSDNTLLPFSQRGIRRSRVPVIGRGIEPIVRALCCTPGAQ